MNDKLRPDGKIEVFEALSELALDMRWSWNHAADEIWIKLDQDLWHLTHNPWCVLQTVSHDKIEALDADPEFRSQVDTLFKLKQQEMERECWFQHMKYPSGVSGIAYFSMEFMLSEALPIYSGGLGNVAGDQLKAASDLGVPVTGIGLLYQQGYFRQVIDKDGRQQAIFPYNDPGQMPVTPMRWPNGEWLRIKLNLPGVAIWLRVWKVRVGRVTLYLLDSNDVANYPPYRGITSELYGGDSYLRLMQEIVLGIGGWRLIEALELKPEVCHLNEGHAAFAALERARSYKEETGLSFESALTVTRAGNLFTTHTAVDAGFDHFSPNLVRQCLVDYAEIELGLSFEKFLGLGRCKGCDDQEYFNMAYLAMHTCGAVNAVSRLHGEVSRRLFEPLFPRWPREEIPIGHVTNGVHMPSWDSAQADELWTTYCGKDRWLGGVETHERDIRQIPDEMLWQFRTESRKLLIEYVRKRLYRQFAVLGQSHDRVEISKQLLDPDILTVGFARRFAVYKRPNLLLNDPDRLLRLLNHPTRPMQLIVAGKAHPADQEAQSLIQQWIEFIHRPEARRRVVFLEDCDMLMTEHLVQGADVWLNTPRRPWEASGTSGMKALVNGGINLSELDGWWAEAYAPELGWALGDGREYGNDPVQDGIEATALYDLLENRVIPEFYSHNEAGISLAWVARMRESMARLTPLFSTNRSVCEYVEKYYLPLAESYHEREKDGAALGNEIQKWSQNIIEKWSALRFGETCIQTDGKDHVIEVEANLENLDPGHVVVELYAEGTDRALPAQVRMELVRKLSAAANIYTYRARVSAQRPAEDYTARIIPCFRGVKVPLERPDILWQK
ncbi:MAG TPA: alpha-glucan family phosphorylase [Burkholderiales bacterium]|nr:alpha-glucan family phosphorylase [Burkholderiales bacterium]